MGSRRFLFTYLASGVFTGLVIVLLVPGPATPAGSASGRYAGHSALSWLFACQRGLFATVATWHYWAPRSRAASALCVGFFFGRHRRFQAE